MVTINRTTQQDRDRKTLAAIQKYLMKMTAITIAGVTYTPQQLIQVIQTDMQLADAATQAKASLQSAAAAARNQRTTLRPFRIGFRSFLENTFTDPSVITEFGLEPRKVGQKTADTKAIAAAKNVATRKARHTMGTNQKKEVTGNVTATVVVTPKSAAPPASQLVPAPVTVKPTS